MWLLYVALALPSIFAGEAAIRDEIEKVLREKIEAELDVEGLAARLEIPYPPVPVKRSVAEIEAIIDEEIEKEIAQHANKTKTEYHHEALEKYPLFEERDEVVLYLKNGTMVRGRLYAIEDGFVKIGDRRVYKFEMVRDSLISVDPELNATYVKKYIRNMKLLEEERQDATAEGVRSRISRVLYLRNGHVMRKNRWIPQTDLLDKAVDWKRKQLRARYEADVTALIYHRHQYQLVDGEWLPPVAHDFDDVALPPQEESHIPKATAGDVEAADGVAKSTIPAADSATPASDVSTSFNEITTLDGTTVKIPRYDGDWSDGVITEEDLFLNPNPTLPTNQRGALPPGSSAGPSEQQGDDDGDVDDAVEMMMLDQLGDDEDGGVALGGVMWIALKLAWYVAAVIISSIALWLGGFFTGVEASVLACFITSLCAQFIKVFMPGGLISGLVATGVTYFLLYKLTSADSGADLILMVVVANGLVQISSIFVIAHLFGM